MQILYNIYIYIIIIIIFIFFNHPNMYLICVILLPVTDRARHVSHLCDLIACYW